MANSRGMTIVRDRQIAQTNGGIRAGTMRTRGVKRMPSRAASRLHWCCQAASG